MAVVSAGVAVAGVALSAYSANQAHEAQNTQERKANDAALKAKQESERIENPDMISAAQQMQSNERRAFTSGGTSTGPSQTIGDGGNQGRKGLLGQ